MSRMKTLFKYFLWFVLFYIFSNIIMYLNIRSLMQEIKTGDIEFQNPQVVIEEAKASKVNAVIKGKIKNTEQNINYKYIRIDLLSERDNILNSKFIDVTDLKNNEEMEFSVRTNTENVKGYKIVLTDIKEVSETNIKMQEVKDMLLGAMLAWMLVY